MTAYIGGEVAPFALRLEGLLVDRPQQGSQVTELHHHHNHSVMPLQQEAGFRNCVYGTRPVSRHPLCAT